MPPSASLRSCATWSSCPSRSSRAAPRRGPPRRRTTRPRGLSPAHMLPADRGLRGVASGVDSRGGGRLAEIGLDDPRIVSDFVGGALGDLLAEVEHDDAIADGADRTHVVL